MIKIIHPQNDTSVISPESVSGDNYITIVETGHSLPVPDYSFSRNRNVYVLHYVLSGSGSCAGQPFTAPCGFLFAPGEEHAYSVDNSPEAPQFEQYWIMFKGYGAKKLLESSGFSTTTGVFSAPYMFQAKELFALLHDPATYVQHQDSLYMKSILFQLLSLHASYAGNINFPQKRVSKEYIAQAILYIEMSYHLPLREEDIANAVHISAKYLYKLFRKELGQSPTQYLNSFRIQRAKKLLTSENLSIKEVAMAVGIPDPDYFCRVFQKHSNGISPTQYKKIK